MRALGHPTAYGGPTVHSGLSVRLLLLVLAALLVASGCQDGDQLAPGPCDLSGTSSAERFIINKESGGRPDAKNPRSTAFGLGQLIEANRRRYLGSDYNTTDCGKQLAALRGYVRDRYGSAEAAQAFWLTNGWY
jgi:hypothetical protein